MSDDLKIQKAIKNYLLKNPDYFTQYPELVTTIKVVQQNGDFTDLTTHQLRTLQKENRELKNQMASLIQNAQQSESMMNRLFSLLLELSVVESDDFLPQFVAFVTEHFKADYFKILLDEALVVFKQDEHLGAYVATHKKHFAVFQSKSEPLSGRLQQAKVQSIFPENENIKSAVVLPIGEGAEFGLMAFASNDQEKFHPNSSSDLLQKLTDILASYIGKHQPADEAQATS